MRIRLSLLPLLLLAVLAGSSTARAGTCVPPAGAGTMGACVTSPPLATIGPPTSGGATLIPDVSEFQGCGLRSEAIYRLYEAGTDRQDAHAACHAAELRRLHAWSAGYFFARPPGFGAAPSCQGQVSRVIAIIHAVGGITGPVIVDAEVPLPAGLVSCLVHQLQHAGYVVVTYTAPGTKDWPDPFLTEVWVAAYPNLPGCFSNACPHGQRAAHHFIAHQFSEASLCRGIFGDCSIAEGILSIRQHHETTAERRRRLQALRDQLLADLHRHGCFHVHGTGAYRLCPRWGAEWRTTEKQLHHR